LGNSGGCKPNSGRCTSLEGTIIWNGTQMTEICPYTWKGNYSSYFSNPFFIIDNLQAAFTVRKGGSKICPSLEPIYNTYQGVMFKFISQQNTTELKTYDFDTKSKIDLYSFDPVNLKLNYLEKQLKNQETTNFRLLWTQLCRQAQSHLDLIWQLMFLDPSIGARVLLQRNDIYAEFTGEVLSIWRCKQYKATTIYYEHNVNGICYKFLPVLVNKQLMFVSPGSSDLMSESPTADCHHIPTGIYKKNSKWFTNAGEIHVSHLPLEMIWRGKHAIFDFHSPTVFHSQLALEERAETTFLKHYLYKTQAMETTINKLINYTSSISIEPDFVYKALKGIGTGLKTSLEELESNAETFVKNTQSNFNSNLQMLIKGPVQAIFNTSIIILLIVLVIYAMFIYITKCRTKKIKINPEQHKCFGEALINLTKQKKLEKQKKRCIVKYKPKAEKIETEFIEIATNFSYCENKRTPHILAEINGKINTWCLLDTGAVFTLIDSKIAEKLNSKIYPANVRPIAANRQTIKIEGAIFLTIKVGDITETVMAYIQDYCTADIILGTNFFHRFKNTFFNWEKSFVKFKNQEISIQGASFIPIEERGILVLNETLEIPTKSFMRFDISIPNKYRDVDAVLFEPQEISVQNVYLPLCVTQPMNGKIVLEVLNTGTMTNKLYKNMKIGKITCLNETTDQIIATNTNEYITKEWIANKANISSSLTAEQKDELLNILTKYPMLYAIDENDNGKTTLMTHKINTGDAKPVKKMPFRTSPKEKEIITKEVQALLEKNIIRPSQSAWSTNIVLVRKKDGKHRVCIDFRGLNEVTKRDVYPIPRIDDILDTLNGAKYFISLDQANAYWSIPIEESDKDKTGFNSPIGLYEFNYLPFGLSNAPASFQRLMDLTLAGLNWQICLTYLDDVLIYAKTYDELCKRLEIILKKLSDANLKLRLEKCKFGDTEVKYLGHIISERGIRPDDSKLEAIKLMKEPKTTKELKSFLGLISYYRKFIENCGKITAPLTRLLKKNVPFIWEEQHQETFEILKKKLLEKPILIHPDFSKPFILQTDACTEGIGAVLSQIKDNQEHPVAYASRTLKSAEKNYGITELETLAVVEFVKHFRPYLYMQKVIVQTDHTAVKSVLQKSNPSSRIARWGLALSGFELDIQPRKGTSNGNADALSRLPMQFSKPCFDIEEDTFYRPQQMINAIMPDIQQINIEQLQKQEYATVYQEIANKTNNEYKIQENILYKQINKELKMVIPTCLQAELIKSYHDDPFAGHFNARKVIKLLSSKYYWPTLQKDVQRYTKLCEKCQINKPTRHKFKASLKPISVNKPFERIAVDCMGPLPITEKGNRFITVFIDYFSKYIEAFATQNITSETIANLFVTKIICRHGAPKILQSDKGSDFTSKLMEEITKLMNVKKIHTSAYHPIANGEVERANQTLMTRIRMYVDKGQADWDEHLSFATFATNINENSTTGYSPFEIIYGRKPNLPIDQALNYSIPITYVDLSAYDAEVKKHFTQALNVIPKEINRAQEKYSRQYDKNTNNIDYKLNDLVLKESQIVQKGKTAKLAPLYEGPYKIIKLNYPNITIQKISDPLKIETIHVNRTKIFHSTKENIENEQNGNKTANNECSKATPQHHTYNLRPRVNTITYKNYDWLNEKIGKDTEQIIFRPEDNLETSSDDNFPIQESLYNRKIPLNGFHPGSFGHLSGYNENELDLEQQEAESEQSSLSQEEYHAEPPPEWGHDKDRPISRRPYIWDKDALEQ